MELEILVDNTRLVGVTKIERHKHFTKFFLNERVHIGSLNYTILNKWLSLKEVEELKKAESAVISKMTNGFLY